MTVRAEIRSTDGLEQDFDSIFLAHWGEIYRYLSRMLGDEAEDVAQDVFLKLHLHPPKPGSNYRAWLYTVATREGLNRLRSRGRQRSLFERLIGLWRDDADSGPEAEVESSDERRRVRAALATMRPLYARLLLLRHEGLDYGELAEVTGTKRSSIGTLLARAERQFEERYLAMGGSV